jgi:hypothetical protein
LNKLLKDSEHPDFAEFLKQGPLKERRLEAIDWAIEREVELIRDFLERYDKHQLAATLYAVASDGTEGVEPARTEDPRAAAQAEMLRASSELEETFPKPELDGETKRHLGRIRRLRALRRYVKENGWPENG